jgi:hypothetical protein
MHAVVVRVSIKDPEGATTGESSRVLASRSTGGAVGKVLVTGADE